jgi:protease PrsW
MAPFLIHALIAIAPVIVCLIIFETVDAFKLVSLTEILALVAAGGVLAAVGYFANGGVLDTFPVRFGEYTRYGAPVVEETMKGLLIVGLFAFNRIGYVIDAAIAGFAIGSGFAVVENLFYLHEFIGASLGVWVVRGFGTAIMHGGASAIFSTLALVLFAPRLRISADRFRFNPLLFLPGLVAAIAMHAAFNHFQNAALVAMVVVVVAVPLGLFVIFSWGDTYAHRWLAEDRETHQKLLDDLRSGAFAASHDGQALAALAARLSPAGAKDLMDYVRLNIELVVRADATLLSLEEHERVALGAEVRGQIHELHALERRLGRTPVMAVRQHLRFSRDDLWKMHELDEDAARRGMRG